MSRGEGIMMRAAMRGRGSSERELRENGGVGAQGSAEVHRRLAGHPPEVAVSAGEFAALITGAQQPVTDSKRPGGRHVEHA